LLSALDETATISLVEKHEIVGHHLASAWEYLVQLGPATGHVRELADRAARKLAAAAQRLELSDVVAAASLLDRATAPAPVSASSWTGAPR